MEELRINPKESPVDYEAFFTIRHLGWLEEHSYISNIPTLGPIPWDYGEYSKEIYDDLQVWGVLEPGGAMSSDASELFSGLTGFDDRWWGVLSLNNERQPIKIDIPEEYEGIKHAIDSTPKIYWMVSRVGDILIRAVRAGNNISITRYTNGTSYDDVAQCVFDILNPTGEWNPARFEEFQVPTSAISEPTKYKLTGDEELDTFTKETIISSIISSGISPSVAKKFVEVYSADDIATSTVLHSSTLENISQESASIIFLYRVGIVLIYTKTGIDGNTWTKISPANQPSLSPVLKTIKESSHIKFL